MEEILNNNNQNNEGSEVCSFYDGLNIFITGGTGFMGKILIEKLLRSTTVSSIYLLIREKKGKNIHQRLDDLFDDLVFKRLKSEVPKYRHRVVGIAGDCSLPGLGLNPEERQLLISRIEVVFHLAATVNFDEKLNLAYNINVKGTSDMLELARQMIKLKCFMHVSTAYSNCHLNTIDEVFYDYPVDFQGIGKLLDRLSDEEVERYTPKLLGSWPNTYTFTKALAEAQIKCKCNGMPLGIFRPAIVVSTRSEPVEAWIDNLYGPTGVCAGVAAGVLRTLHCDDQVVADIVPVDMCVAALICSAWDVAKRNCERTPENVPIFNYVSSADNPITWGEYNNLNQLNGINYPPKDHVWTLCFSTTPSAKINAINKLFYHYIPAILTDIFLLLLLKKPKMLTAYAKIHKFSNVISYFCTRNWKFSNDNTKKLCKKLNRKDKEIFSMDIRELNWIKYFRTYILGIRLYLFKDPIETVPKAKIKSSRLVILHHVLKTVLYFTISILIWSWISKIFS